MTLLLIYNFNSYICQMPGSPHTDWVRFQGILFVYIYCASTRGMYLKLLPIVGIVSWSFIFTLPQFDILPTELISQMCAVNICRIYIRTVNICRIYMSQPFPIMSTTYYDQAIDRKVSYFQNSINSQRYVFFDLKINHQYVLCNMYFFFLHIVMDRT